MLDIGTQRPATVAAPPSVDVPAAIVARHDIQLVDPLDIVALLATAGLDVSSMGRPAADDPLVFECASAAGILAAQHVT